MISTVLERLRETARKLWPTIPPVKPADLMSQATRQWRTFLRQWWDVTPYPIQSLWAGCPECPGIDSWPLRRLASYAYATLLLWFVAKTVGKWPEITSGYRCGPCNSRRGGVSQSRHLGTDSPGKGYAAFDVQWETTGPALQLKGLLETGELQQRFREWVGLNLGIGVIVYGRRLHIDIRERDYFEVKPGAFA